MNKQQFIDERVNHLINSDADVKKYFESAKDNAERARLEQELRQELSQSYDHYAKEYFENKGLGSYVSSFLRVGGAAADLLGTYMFWALGGAGFGFKGAGLVAKTIADAIDSAHYAKHTNLEDHLNTDPLEIVGEGLAERAAAYLPLGIGEIADLLRGTKKYDSKIVSRTVYKAKDEFLKRFGEYKPHESEEPQIVPLSNFRNQLYSSEAAFCT